MGQNVAAVDSALIAVIAVKVIHATVVDDVAGVTADITDAAIEITGVAVVALLVGVAALRHGCRWVAETVCYIA